MTETETAPVPTIKPVFEEKLQEPAKVIVYDDPVNLMEYVVIVFRRIFGYSKDKATELMNEVHHKGRSIVWEGELEKAELFTQQLQQYQLNASVES